MIEVHRRLRNVPSGADSRNVEDEDERYRVEEYVRFAQNRQS